MPDCSATLSDWGAALMLRGNYVYLMGASARAGGRFSFLAAKYGRTAGGLKWARVSDVAGDVDTTAGVWVDGDGNVTVGGDLAVTGPELKRGAVVSWNRYGVFRWSRPGGSGNRPARVLQRHDPPATRQATSTSRGGWGGARRTTASS